MAIPIQSPTVGQLLQNLFGLQGRVRPALEEFIVPVVNVADVAKSAGVSIRRSVVGRFTIAAVVGELPQIQMAVPAGIIARVTKLYLWSDTVMQVRIHHGNGLAAAPPTAMSTRYTDWRLLSPTFQNPAVIPTVGTAAAGLAVYEEVYRLFTVNRPIELEWDQLGGVVVGGTSTTGYFEVAAVTANSSLNGTLMWEEYQLNALP